MHVWEIRQREDEAGTPFGTVLSGGSARIVKDGGSGTFIEAYQDRVRNRCTGQYVVFKVTDADLIALRDTLNEAYPKEA